MNMLSDLSIYLCSFYHNRLAYHIEVYVEPMRMTILAVHGAVKIVAYNSDHLNVLCMIDVGITIDCLLWLGSIYYDALNAQLHLSVLCYRIAYITVRRIRNRSVQMDPVNSESC